MDVEIFHPADIRGTLENRKICIIIGGKGILQKGLLRLGVRQKETK